MRIDRFTKITLQLYLPILVIGLCLPVIAGMIFVVIAATQF